MEIDLKSAGIGAGVGAVIFGSIIWLGGKLAKKPNKDKTTTSWEDLSEIEKYFKQSRSEKSKDNLSDNVKLMKEIVDSNMPASLIKEAGEEVGITFTGECRKEMIKILFLNGKDGVAAIKKQYEKWKNKEFASEKKEENSESQTDENKSEESK